ncbi:MAG: hypothetical protein II916_01695 [Oscillospiraceae bacterium]|nr:hypothetical protein [Oscillospiraceae bacterium]
MGNFMSLPESIKGCLLLWLTILSFLLLIVCLRDHRTERSRCRLFLSAAEVLFSFTFDMILTTQIARTGDFLIGIPAVTVMVLIAALTAITGSELIRILKPHKQKLSALSVKESVDHLPTGICFYYDGGLTKLVNLKMDSISQRLFGENVSNAEYLWDAVSKGETSYAVSSGERPVICFDDGTAYSFDRRKVMLSGTPIWELLAFDITEEYRLTAELREKQRQADYINTRLKALNSTIQYVIMEKETLQIKINIHDSFGQTLLMTKRYLTDPAQTDKGEMLRLWRRNIALLKNEEREAWQRPYYVTLRHAGQLGVSVVLTGALPEEERLVPVINSAITVHVSNVLRHAQGNEAYITSEETADSYTLRFTNNGKAPETQIRENGGLANLRQKVGSIGGRMQISSSPVFVMLLTLPKDHKEP